MARTSLLTYLRHLTRGEAAGSSPEEPDRQLVGRFLAHKDGTAFEALVRRHGPMVYRVCRGVLGHDQDAEDAFQATFLVLAQNLRGVRDHASLASWLHGVARRVALKAGARAARRRLQERRSAGTETAEPDEAGRVELHTALDEELAKLGEKWRLPLILCYLEGRTQEQAAGELGCSKTTLRRRLGEARAALERRLRRRGVVGPAAVAATALAGPLAPASPRPGLVATTMEAVQAGTAGQPARAVTSEAVAALAEGVCKTMLPTKLKLGAAALLLSCLVGAGLAGLAGPAESPGRDSDVSRREHRTRRLDPQPAGRGKAQPEPEVDKLRAEVERLRQQLQRVLYTQQLQQARQALAEEAVPRPGEPLGLDAPVQQMRWSRNGAVMAGRSSRRQNVGGKEATLTTFRVWDAATGKLKVDFGELEYPGLMTFDLSPDGKVLALSRRGRIEDGDRLELFETGKGRLIQTIRMAYARSRVWFSFSPDGGAVAVCGCDIKDDNGVVRTQGTIRLFDTGTGQLVRKLVSPGHEVIAAAHSGDGRRVAAGSTQGEITVWEAATGQVVRVMADSCPVGAIAFSPDGNQVASGGRESPVLVWDVNGGKARPMAGRKTRTDDVVFSLDGRHLAAQGDIETDAGWKPGVRVWEVRTGKLIQEHATPAKGVAFTPDGRRLVLLTDPKTVRFIDLERGTDEANPEPGGNGRDRGEPEIEVRGAVLQAIHPGRRVTLLLPKPAATADDQKVQPSDTRTRLEAIEVSPDPMIVINGRQGTLADLQPGMHLTIRLRGGQRRVTIWSVTVEE